MTDILMPYAAMDPSGMSAKARRAIENAMPKLDLKMVGYRQEKFGHVYVAEALKEGQWHVVVASRNVMFELYCHAHTAQNARIQAAVDKARELVGETHEAA